MRAWYGCAGLALLALAACTQKNPEYDALSAPPPPPAAVLGPALDSVPLATKLARMQALLDDAVAHGITGQGTTRIVAVKLLADRLLEVPPPFPWLRDAYYTDTRLRQVQALADRILAELRRDDVDESVARADTRALRDAVARLRQELALGGTHAPVPVDSLLASIPKEAGIGQGEVTD
ncbi:MAG TPA: hypothetical protein VF832_11765 [Longimicrobiales bacterium]